GINLGAFLSSLIVGYVGENIGWHWGFGLAGIAMALGLLVYLWGQKYLRNVGNLLSKAERDEGASFGGMFRDLFKSPLQLTITGVLMAFSIYWVIMEDLAYGFLFIFLTLVTAMMLMVYKDLTSQVMKDRYVVMLLSFILVIVFWGAFEQAGGLMNIYALEKTDRSLPFTLPLIGNEVPASWFQSLNALFIIIFGVIVANFWAKRKLKSKEASSIFKMAIGVIIMGLGFVFMVFASMQFQSNGSSAMYWLVLAYLFHTIGELSSSPVALSFITKLAPVKYASLMMGVYFAATGLGNKVAGIVGELSSEAGDQSIFMGITIFTVAFATLVLLMLKPLKRLTHGVEDEERELPQQENFELGDEDIVDKEEYKHKK
ncbi:MAG TPA: MFS transporter, partial [Salinimicrobium catena]|nr:MFS transporter [Salinimicrobium catena]